MIPPADADTWALAKGTLAGLPKIIRYRPGLRQFLGDESFPKLLTVTWRYGASASRLGMPDKVQADEMERFENCLVEALDPDRTAVLAFVLTHDGVREWNYYFSDEDLLSERINLALRDQPDLPIGLESQDDSNWTEFRAVLSAARAAADPS